PTRDNLKGASVYVIVDPDTKKETDQPNFIQPDHAAAITDWVKSGGILVLMGNDMNNAEFEHFNQLADKFGMKFNSDNQNQVVNDQYPQGEIEIPAGNPVFRKPAKIFVKEYSSIAVNKPAVPLVKKGDYVVMATARSGKGVVFAIGDPWIYNEYVDGRKLPAEYQNYAAATDLVQWLLKQ
ncbi:MAG TPA: glycoside hydrolase family 88 protein, partial [Flavitalea sp.]|nr:glycoside hydrolase family 88 protein [Flavitalea sp.]